MKLDSADWILVSSHLFAHHIAASRPDIPTFVYAHTPARYIWYPELDTRSARVPLVRPLLKTLREYDRYCVTKGNAKYAANSRYVRDRISACWNVESDVIYPPVEVDKIIGVRDWTNEVTGTEQGILDNLPETFVLGASRFVPYKRLDLVIEAAARVGVDVVLAGSGPDRLKLEQIAERAGTRCLFVDRPSDSLLYALYQRAEAYVFPAIEDFGIMPVEAMAAGAPVITGSLGGATESVIDKKTGVHLAEWDQSSFDSALRLCSQLKGEAPRLRAAEFSNLRFEERIKTWMHSVL
nr:glycosyltransferase [Gordonia desulfuricans]